MTDLVENSSMWFEMIDMIDVWLIWYIVILFGTLYVWYGWHDLYGWYGTIDVIYTNIIIMYLSKCLICKAL